jgi:hypothetical protein
MSYILNALKKAERDRLREDPKELEDFASANWDPYQQSSSNTGLKRGLLVGVIIMLSVAVGAFSVAYLSSQELSVALTESAPTVQSEPISLQAPTVVKEPELALSSTSEIPELSISGHMYFSEGSSSNRLFANDQSYRENDNIGRGWVVSKIGLEGVEIRAGERTVFFPYP